MNYSGFCGQKTEGQEGKDTGAISKDQSQAQSHTEGLCLLSSLGEEYLANYLDPVEILPLSFYSTIMNTPFNPSNTKWIFI